MLTILAYAMMVVFMYMILRKKMTPFNALLIIPALFGVIAAVFGLFPVPDPSNPEVMLADPNLGERLTALGEFALEGMNNTATTGVMLLFAILYFSIMLNAGMFDPITTKMIQFANGDPVKIVVATAIVAAAVSLNGDGTTTTLIVCTAFLPIYRYLGMKTMNLAIVTVLMNTIMNLLPWGGPTARAISVLALDSQTVVSVLAPGMILSILYMLGVSVYLGRQERNRLGVTTLSQAEIGKLTEGTDEDQAKKRPENFWVNLILTIIVLVLLIGGFLPAPVIFIIGTALALGINYSSLKEQKNRISENAADAVQVVILVFAAGIFMGIFTGTGMADGIAQSLTYIIPESWGRAWGLITALISAPGTFFLSNDAFYYGVVPVLAEAGNTYGFSNMEIGIASLLGQAFHLLSPLVAFIYLLIEMTDVDMGEWQKQSGKWALGIFIIFILAAQFLTPMNLVH